MSVVQELTHPAVPPPSSTGTRVKAFAASRSWLPAMATSVVLVAVAGVISPGFASWQNINQLLAAAAILAIAASAQTLVMLSGDFGIDLSVGQVMSLTAVASYITMEGGTAYLPLGFAVAVVIGAVAGLVNGALVAVVRLPALVVTLAMLVIAQGAIFALTRAGTPDGSVPPLLLGLTTEDIFGVKYVTILAAVFLMALGLFLKRSRFGRMLYLVGSNREASRMSGLPVKRIVILTFVLAGVCSGFAGMLLLSYAGTANLDLGASYLLLSIAAAVVGGTSLAGGEGNIGGAAAGALALTVVAAFMLTLGASESVRQMAIGGMLLVLLAFNARTPRLRQ